jgi:hypothetical protein
MIDFWKDFREAIKNRYGHWSSADRARMLLMIQRCELYIEKTRTKENERHQVRRQDSAVSDGGMVDRVCK